MNDATREAAKHDNIAGYFLAERAGTPEEREAILALGRALPRRTENRMTYALPPDVVGSQAERWVLTVALDDFIEWASDSAVDYRQQNDTAAADEMERQANIASALIAKVNAS